MVHIDETYFVQRAEHSVGLTKIDHQLVRLGVHGASHQNRPKH